MLAKPHDIVHSRQCAGACHVHVLPPCNAIPTAAGPAMCIYMHVRGSGPEAPGCVRSGRACCANRALLRCVVMHTALAPHRTAPHFQTSSRPLYHATRSWLTCAGVAMDYNSVSLVAMTRITFSASPAAAGEFADPPGWWALAKCNIVYACIHATVL